MKINELPLELLHIFEEILNNKMKYKIQSYRLINTQSHVKLQQDAALEHYAFVVHDLLISEPPLRLQEYLDWQVLETYRIVNTSLTSVLMKDLDLTLVQNFKERLENVPFLKSLLQQIADGKITPGLVCSGHGVWHSKFGHLDLTSHDSKVVFYSAPGASLSERLAVDIENDRFDGRDVAVFKTDRAEEEGEVEEEKPVSDLKVIQSYPKFFSARTAVTKIPDYMLVQCDTKLPVPRVIEPLTGRVLMNLANPDRRNYFLLSEVLHKFHGQDREVAWAGCTGYYGEAASRAAEFSGYRWTIIKKEGSPKRSRTEESEADTTTISKSYRKD